MVLRARAILLILLMAATSLAVPAAGQTPSLEEPIPKPDLVPANGRVNATDETRPFDLCAEVYNVHGDGQTTHGPFDIILYLDGFEAGVKRVTEVLLNGHGKQVCWTMQLDAGVHRYHFIVDANDEVDEHDETNNVAVQRSFRVYPTPQPDLLLEWFDVAPRVGESGRPQTFRAVVRNIGTAPSEPTHALFQDETGVLDRVPVPALEPGARYEPLVLTRPDLRQPGLFIANVVIDPNNTVTEINETNNEGVRSYEVAEHPLANLRIANLTLEGEPMARVTMRLNFTIENIGDRDAKAFIIRIYDDEKPLLNASRGGLGAGANTTARFLVSMTGGEHRIRVMVDPDNYVVERDETDNAEEVVIQIAEPEKVVELPNLVVERVDAAPNDPRPGETVTLLAFLRNTGTVRANASIVDFTINGELLGSATAPALDPGRYASVTLSWPIFEEGSYTIRALTDRDGEVNESDETDNELSRTFVVVPPPPPEGPKTPTPTPGDGNDTPPIATPPTPPTNPTNPTTPPPDETPPTGPRVEVGEITVSTRPVPGGTKAIVVASLRNPSFDPIGRVSVAFKVDGKVVKEVLADGVGAAITAPISSGEADVPAGTHTMTVEVRLIGGGVIGSGTKEYTAEAGEESGVPGLGVGFGLLSLAAAAFVMRARRRP